MKKKLLIAAMALVSAFSCAAMSACDLFKETDLDAYLPGSTAPETPETPSSPTTPTETETPSGTTTPSTPDTGSQGSSVTTPTTPNTSGSTTTEPTPHTHTYVEGVCNCGATDPTYVPSHTHTYVEGVCNCGATDPTYVPPHTHTYVEGVCNCGATDPTYVPPHTHTYVEGVCNCGATDPNYVPPHTHTYEKKVGDNGHWTECVCGEKTEVVAHSFNFVVNGDKHYQKCSSGNETTEEVYHTFVQGVCECGANKPAQELDYEINADGDAYTVTGIGTVTSKAVVIPETYHGLPVTQIKREAFKGNGMTSVSIPTSMVKVGDNAFYECTSLNRVDYNGTISQWASIEFDWWTSNPLRYAHSLYINGQHVVNVVIEGIEAVGGCAFAGADIQSVKISSGVTGLGGFAFYYCENLVSAEMPDSVTEVGNSVFNECTKLSTVRLSNNITEITHSMFSHCTSLKTISIPQKVTKIGYYAFMNSGLTSVTIPAAVEEIGLAAFGGCFSMGNIYFEDTTHDWQADAGHASLDPQIMVSGIQFKGYSEYLGTTLSDSAAMAKVLSQTADAFRAGLINWAGILFDHASGNQYQVLPLSENIDPWFFKVVVMNMGQELYTLETTIDFVLTKTDSTVN